MKRVLGLLWGLGALASVNGCGGNAIDIDRPNLPSAGAAGGAAVESAQVNTAVWFLAADSGRAYWITSRTSYDPLALDLGQAQSCVFEDCAATSTTYGA